MIMNASNSRAIYYSTSFQLAHPTRVAIYARCAHSGDAAQTVAAQVARCKAFAERRGWIVTCIFQDAPASGAGVAPRDGLIAMMAAARHGSFHLVLAQDLARLSRSAVDAHRLVNGLTGLGVGVWTVDNGEVEDLTVAFRQAPVAHRIFKDHLAGLTSAEIAGALNAEGVLVPSAWRSGPRVTSDKVESVERLLMAKHRQLKRRRRKEARS
jgi:hypothetical protein